MRAMSKKSHNFDVKKGLSEVCQLISIFMLSLFGNKFRPNSIGLYRDDGLAV